MDCYEIEWKASARKELERLPSDATKKILLAVKRLPSNLHPTGSKKILSSEHTYRLRIGNYRVIYSIEHNHLIIEIIRVGHRKDIYRKVI